MSKQDRVAARTPADLERKWNLRKNFSEVLGVANDARASAEDAKEEAKELTERVEDVESGLSAQFKLTIEEDETKTFSLLDGKATKIHFDSDSIAINSENFKLQEDGSVEAKKGSFGNAHIEVAGTINGIPFDGIYFGESANDTFLGVTNHNGYRAVLGLGLLNGTAENGDCVLITNKGIELGALGSFTWRELRQTVMRMEALYTAHPELFMGG